MSYYDYKSKQIEMEKMIDQLQLLDFKISWSTNDKNFECVLLIVETNDFRMCFNVDRAIYIGNDLKSIELKTKIIDYSINKFKRAYVKYINNLKEIGEVNHVI